MIMYRALEVSPAWRVEMIRHQLDFIQADQGTFHCHHITLEYPIAEYHRPRMTEQIMLTHSGVSANGVLAMKPLLSEYHEAQDNPHLTIFVPHGAKAVDAGTITNWEPLLSPWMIDVQEVTLDGKTPTPMWFHDKRTAIDWLLSKELEYMDNLRYAKLSDAAGYSLYMKQKDSGCCGSIDQLIIVGQELAMIGCNYGH